METPPCFEERRVGGCPDGAGADPPPEWDDRQGVFDALCAPAHQASTPETTTLRRRGQAHQARRSCAPSPRHPRLRMRRSSATVMVMFVQSPPVPHCRETSKDRHGARKAVCGFCMRLRGGPLVHLQSKRIIAWRKAP
jgi:hypothetical protein